MDPINKTAEYALWEEGDCHAEATVMWKGDYIDSIRIQVIDDSQEVGVRLNGATVAQLHALLNQIIGNK